MRRVSLQDCGAAWILTGPIGRVIAFAGDLGAAVGRWALRRAANLVAETRDIRG